MRCLGNIVNNISNTLSGYNRFNDLSGYQDKYIITDLREKQKKDLTEVKNISRAKIGIEPYKSESNDVEVYESYDIKAPEKISDTDADEIVSETNNAELEKINNAVENLTDDDIEKQNTTSSTVNFNDISRRFANASHWSSFDPERSGKFWGDSMQATYNDYVAKVPYQYRNAFDNFFNNYVDEIISLRSRTANAAVTGGGGISASKARKLNAAQDRFFEKMVNFNEAIERYVKKLNARANRAEFLSKGLNERSNDRVDELKREVEALVNGQKKYSEYKKDLSLIPESEIDWIKRAYKNDDEWSRKFYLESLLYKLGLIRKGLQDKIEREQWKGNQKTVNDILDYCRDKDVFAKRNRVWNLYKKIDSEARESYDYSGGKDFEKITDKYTIDNYDGVEVVENKELDRLQLKFSSIPDAQVREKLKSSGFRWSPHYGVWQRKLTPAAAMDAQSILSKYFLKTENKEKAAYYIADLLKEYGLQNSGSLRYNYAVINFPLKVKKLVYDKDGVKKFIIQFDTDNPLQQDESLLIFKDGKFDRFDNDISEINRLKKESLISDNTEISGLNAILNGYGDLYEVRDLRKRGRKEPSELAANKNLVFTNISSWRNTYENFDHTLFQNEKYESVRVELKNTKYFIKFNFFIAKVKDKNSPKKYRGNEYVIEKEVEKKDLHNIKNLDYVGGNFYSALILKSLYNSLEKEAFNDFLKKLDEWVQKAKDNILKEQNSSWGNKEYWVKRAEERLKEAEKERKYTLDYYNNNKDSELQGVNDILYYQTLGKPTIKFEFDTNDELKKFLTENKENLIDSYIDADEYDFESKQLNGLSKKENDIFNCSLNQLNCKGLKTTYKKLSDYSSLIDAADNLSKLVGYGFENATLQQLKNACKYAYQVNKLARHLKGDSPLQSAFNIWYWLHENIRYAYDTAGIEEIRLPARTWADRKRGVDCDCLAVFTACLLLNMGYNPKFEIVAFCNNPNYSHIFVNLDGIAIDRVLPVFNYRPSLITKTYIMSIPVMQLSGITDILQRKKYNTFNAEQLKQDDRKLRVLVTLKNADKNIYRFATIIMPYVAKIDDSGAYYFYEKNIAEQAAQKEKELITMLNNNTSQSVLDGWFKDIFITPFVSAGKAVWNATKSAANSIWDATTGTYKFVKSGIQFISGNKDKAKETLKDAGSDFVSSAVQPFKDAWNITVDVTKDAVINPTKRVIEIGGKLFKIIFIILNPLFILMRNSLRLLIAINFLGMASRLKVATMTESEALKAGYSKDAYNKAKKAYDRVIRFFTKIGGKKSNIEKSINNGAKKKALFGKDYKPDTKIIETSEDSATLAGLGKVVYGIDGLGVEGVTIGSALAAVGAFLAKIWTWLKDVVMAVANWVKEHKEVVNVATTYLKDKIGSKSSSSNDTSTDTTTTDTTENDDVKKKIGIAIAATAGAAGLYMLLQPSSKKR